MITFNFMQTPITQIADAIIIDAARRGSSDIHFDPRDNGVMVRIRIDGDLVDYAHVPKEYERNLITRLKLMSGMNITESRLPQDGAIKGNFGGKDLDMRCSSLPTNEGEKIVIRILDYSRSLSGIDSLGFSKENYEKINRMVDNPNGIILVTGATGTGKSTTVYSMLQVLNKERTNVITVEDPIEMNIEGLNQVQVNSEIGLTFSAVLRSILRQDPNVILIGEIRDSETAKIAVRAAITGHLVLSTIHTNNSLSTIERLLDMDVEKYLLSSAISGIISQKLAKMLCPKCRIKREATPYEKKVYKLALKKDIDEIYDANPDGCDYCNNGYRGRLAIQEVLEIDDSIKSVINEQENDKEELRKVVYGNPNVITLLQDGLQKVLEGQTSFEEIYKIIEIDNDIDDSELQVMTEAVKSTKNKELVELKEMEEKSKKELESKVKTEVSDKINTVVESKNVDKTNISKDNIETKSSSTSIVSNNNIKKLSTSSPAIVPEIKLLDEDKKDKNEIIDVIDSIDKKEDKTKDKKEEEVKKEKEIKEDKNEIKEEKEVKDIKDKDKKEDKKETKENKENKEDKKSNSLFGKLLGDKKETPKEEVKISKEIIDVKDTKKDEKNNNDKKEVVEKTTPIKEEDKKVDTKVSTEDKKTVDTANNDKDNKKEEVKPTIDSKEFSKNFIPSNLNDIKKPDVTNQANTVVNNKPINTTSTTPKVEEKKEEKPTTDSKEFSKNFIPSNLNDIKKPDVVNQANTVVNNKPINTTSTTPKVEDKKEEVKPTIDSKEFSKNFIPSNLNDIKKHDVTNQSNTVVNNKPVSNTTVSKVEDKKEEGKPTIDNKEFSKNFIPSNLNDIKKHDVNNTTTTVVNNKPVVPNTTSTTVTNKEVSSTNNKEFSKDYFPTINLEELKKQNEEKKEKINSLVFPEK